MLLTEFLIFHWISSNFESDSDTDEIETETKAIEPEDEDKHILDSEESTEDDFSKVGEIQRNFPRISKELVKLEEQIEQDTDIVEHVNDEIQIDNGFELMESIEEIDSDKELATITSTERESKPESDAIEDTVTEIKTVVPDHSDDNSNRESEQTKSEQESSSLTQKLMNLMGLSDSSPVLKPDEIAEDVTDEEITAEETINEIQNDNAESDDDKLHLISNEDKIQTRVLEVSEQITYREVTKEESNLLESILESQAVRSVW